MLSNTLFRMGGAAILLTNKSMERSRAKYRLTTVVRVHKVIIKILDSIFVFVFILIFYWIFERDPMIKLIELFIKNKMMW